MDTSSSALETQIWTALTALLLLTWLHPFPSRIVTVQPGRHIAPKSLHIQGVACLVSTSLSYCIRSFLVATPVLDSTVLVCALGHKAYLEGYSISYNLIHNAYKINLKGEPREKGWHA
ncbi:hypothetical protein DFAR_1470018 [Desulfarculales bacterium]